MQHLADRAALGPHRVASREGGVDCNSLDVLLTSSGEVASREGGVDCNSKRCSSARQGLVASREGGVDCNTSDRIRGRHAPVASREGGVDCNQAAGHDFRQVTGSPPAREAWIATGDWAPCAGAARVASREGGVDCNRFCPAALI